MALTPEQKALNKEATRLRDRAFDARRRDYLAALETATKPIVDGPLAEATRQAVGALDEAMETRDRTIDALRVQIAALTEKIEDARREHGAAIERLKATRDSAYDRLNKAKALVQDQVEKDFPDMKRCYGAAAWKPFQDFLEQARGNTTSA